jgi:hypothetical protein
MSLRDVFFERIMSIRRAQRAAAARKSAITVAPAAPSSPAGSPPPVQTQPAQPESFVRTERWLDAACGIWRGSGSHAKSLNEEFPPDVATANWRASLDRPAPDFGPPIDVSESNVIKLHAAQVRVSKE